MAGISLAVQVTMSSLLRVLAHRSSRGLCEAWPAPHPSERVRRAEPRLSYGVQRPLIYMWIPRLCSLPGTSSNSCRIHLALPLATACKVAFVQYTPPDVTRLESLALDSYLSHSSVPPTRLEQLIGMDCERCSDLRSEIPAGSGLRSAVRHINMARWALRAPPCVPVSKHWQLPVRPATPLALVNRIMERVYAVLAWPAYWNECSLLTAKVASGDTPSIPAHLVQARTAANAAWNALLLYVCDMALGYLLSSALEAHEAWLVQRGVQLLDAMDAPALRSVLDWLAHWPLGIKLNTELALFSRDVLASIAEAHSAYVLQPLFAHLSQFVQGCCWVSRCLGATVLLSVLLDTLMVLGMHVRGMYFLVRHVYLFFTRAAGSLFDMFRGKKRNPIHHGRLDTAEYEVDQLFLGTILFTLLVFLFPTVLMFYATVAAAHLAVLCVYAGLVSLVRLLGALPLYTLILRVWNSARVPCGVALVGQYRMKGCAIGLTAALAPLHSALRPLAEVPHLVWCALCGAPLHVPL